MNTLSEICKWGGLLFILIGSFLRYDRRPGREHAGKISDVIGYAGQGINILIDVQRTLSAADARRACWLRSSYPEVQACIDQVHTPSFLSGLFSAFIDNAVLVVIAVGAGWLLAKLVPGHGPESA
jgi:hypothetical protein